MKYIATSTAKFNEHVNAFTTKEAAVAQIIEWQRELEVEGWSIKRINGERIMMTRIECGERQYAELYVRTK